MDSSGDGAMQVIPNRSVGFMVLGASIYDILAQIKSQPTLFTSLKFYYTPDKPLSEPFILALPNNGIRLRFDGPDQRLRLIEITDFSKTKLVYKDTTAGKGGEAPPATISISSGNGGPSFRHVYDKLLGPTFPGEYSPPKSNDGNVKGTYLLSYPGVAFCFPVRHSAYSPSKDFIPLLSSSATSLATSMLVFHGESWAAVRDTLYTSSPPHPRSSALAKGKDDGHDEIELVKVSGEGRLEFLRRSGSGFEIILGETSAQDLITELGAPDAIHSKNDRRLSIHKERTSSETSDHSVGILSSDHDDSDSNHSSILHPDLDDEVEDDSDWEDDETASEPDEEELASAEQFYNYFGHGFDILLSEPRQRSPNSPTSRRHDGEHDDVSDDEALPFNRLAATKIIFHGNIPGSYQFNRHRRSRWTLEHVPYQKFRDPLTSEMPFTDISERLKKVFKGTYENHAEEVLMQRGMAINRGWGDSPGSSCELLGGFEDTTNNGKKYAHNNLGLAGIDGPDEHDVPGLGSTMLYGFPGLIFEVMENDMVSTLTVY